MNTKHTPTPWKKGARINEDHGIRIDSPSGLVAIARGAGGPWSDVESNAKHIVHCVNQHAALVAALDNCLKELDFIFPPGGPYITAQVEARALLADEVGK